MLSRQSTVRQLGIVRGRRAFSTAIADSGSDYDFDHKVKYPHLFSPLKLNNGIVLPNRVLMGSMHTGLEGHSTPEWVRRWILGSKEVKHDLKPLAQYFRERAEGGVGLMVTGGISPNREGWLGMFGSQLISENEMLLHRQVTEAVRDVHVPMLDGSSQPARICMQILHAGRYGYHPWCVSASATKSPISPFKARELTEDQIERTIDDFVRCASLAKLAGYDGVEIMGSEGYLISQFLCLRTNHRTDRFGGSLENRARLPLEIIRRTREATGSQFIIIFRLSVLDLVEGGLRWDESVQLAKMIEQAGANILNSGIGWHEARQPTIATSVPRGAFVRPTAALKEAGVVDIPIVATNRINTPRVAEAVLADGSSDMVSMARPLLADPEFLSKTLNEREDEIITCIACNQACLDHVFEGKTASCLVNPRSCNETTIQPRRLPEKDRMRLGVVGAGPSGCAFAITAAQMGHEVTLFDAGSEIGGQFNMAKRIPGKEEFHEVLRYFRTVLKKQGVNVELGRHVTFADMEDSSVDKWILATGVNPRDPLIAGSNHPKVLSYIDVLQGNAQVGKKVAIIGAGGIGFDVAEFLLHSDTIDRRADDLKKEDFWATWGVDPNNRNPGGLCDPLKKPADREIILMQRKKGRVGAGLGKTTGWIHRATLKNSEAVEMLNGVTYDHIDDNGNLHITTKDGSSRALEVDNIVLCAGQIVRNELEEMSVGTSLQHKVFTIGGAFQAGELDAKRAIDMGTRLAIRIHEDSVVPGKHYFHAPVGEEEKLTKLLRRFV